MRWGVGVVFGNGGISGDSFYTSASIYIYIFFFFAHSGIESEKHFLVSREMNM